MAELFIFTGLQQGNLMILLFVLRKFPKIPEQITVFSGTGQISALSFQRALSHVFCCFRLLHMPLLHYGIDCSHWLFRITCGSVEIRTVYAGHRQFKVAD